MRIDTLFDIASITKVVATTTAVLQFVERGNLGLDDPVVKYWPEFKENEKERIALRHLLTHTSGLRADLDLNPPWLGYEGALQKIVEEKPNAPPGNGFLYSDINFEILGELVQRASGLSLDAYCREHIFKPLGMKDTCFKPGPALFDRIAPTRNAPAGEVHDPTAHRMGGVAGHAGLFSTADDLSLFCQMLLNGGSLKNAQILSPAMVERMTVPQSPPEKTPARGLGWNIGPVFASNRDSLPPVGSYGHKGFTGTSIWIDPVSRTYVILLTNRVHANSRGNAEPLRDQIISLVSEALGPVSADQVLDSQPGLAPYFRETLPGTSRVQTGIDVLLKQNFASLAGLRVGLLTNHSGRDSSGRRTLDLLYAAPGTRLAAIFSPEHGLYGREDRKVSSAQEPLTGLPVYSLYGEDTRPTEKMLQGLDALVYDIQDAGVRFFTYITTLGYAMEVAAKKGIDFYVLDRPNPITGSHVQGPILDKELNSFTGYYPLPLRHGMTVGELAGLFNAEKRIGAKLHVIRMEGYKRTDWYDETGLPWTHLSPNLRTLTQATLYPGVAMVEGANVSVGRGTETPFELLGAPWMDGKKLAEVLNSREINGVTFSPVDFTPDSSLFKDQACHGVRILLTDRQTLDAGRLGIEIASTLHRLYPGVFELDKTLHLVGSRPTLQAIKEGQDPRTVLLTLQGPLEAFLALRSNYLLY
jgi:uncharacterized protein YbbC (DUF1343 family)/CubicO group peptidase (beta-lactamase class C family)